MTIRSDATRLRTPQRDKRLRRSVVARQGQVLLDADLNQQGEATLGRIEAEARAVMGSPGRVVYPAGETGFAIAPDGTPSNFNIGAGDAYLDGWLLQNPSQAKLATQFHPRLPALTLPALIAVKALVRHIDPVEERGLPDVALGDAQASGRSIVDWQVLPVTIAAATADPLADQAWLGMIAASSGKLAFKLKAFSGSPDPCSLTPQGGYSRHENLLYRVEVHGGVAAEQRADGPRFGLNGLKLKFSRRNASVMARIVKIDGPRITVAPPALDRGAWFAPGMWAEIVSIHDDLDPDAALASERLFQVAQATDDVVTLTEAGVATVAGTGAVAPAKPDSEADWFLRLWTAFPAAAGTTPSGIATVSAPGAATDSAEIDLGDGVSIQLTGGAAARFRRGDYWTCAVRADGTIAWSQDPTLANAAEPPQGPEVRYGPLATIANNAFVDLRIPLASLTHRALLYRGGDGQTAPLPPGGALARLPAKLRVAVMRGESPVPGARVRWQVLNAPAAGGRIVSGAQTGADLHLTTDANGLSEVAWEIDPAHAGLLLQVSATLEDGLQPGSPPVIYTAGFDREGNHGGCSTYVIPEGADWVALLENMDFSQDIAVCFQRGLFKTERTVLLKGARNIKISGAGDGTVLLAKDLETVLQLEGFAGAVVERIRIETGDDKSGRKLGFDRQSGRNGSLTLRDCAISEVRNATLRCGGQLVTGRTALTIAGTEKAPIRLARVIDNRVIVGFLQDGVLVIDCEDATISGNELIAARRSAELGDKLIRDSLRWKRAAARALIDRLDPYDKPSASPEKRFIQLGALRAEFLSPIPQPEWDKMAAALPFDGAADPTPTDVVAYVKKLVDTTISDPARAQQTTRVLLDNARRRGERLDEAGQRILASSVMLPSGVEAVAAARSPTRAEGDGAVVDGAGVRFGTFGVRFASPVSPQSWAQLYNDASVYKHPRPTSASMLADQLRALAMILVGDARLRAKYAEVVKWHDAVGLVAPAAARHAITCGGAVLTNVAITGNRASGFACGAHVGASVRSENGTRTIQNARISDNDFALRLPAPLSYFPAALFLGNVETGRIDRNLVTMADRDGKAGGWAHGLRVWGEIGHYLMIAENHVAGPSIGIKVRPTNAIPEEDLANHLWVARDNLVLGVGPGNVVHAPKLLQRRDNMPS